MRAKFVRICQLIAAVGINRVGPACQASERPAVGNALGGVRRNISRALRGDQGHALSGFTGVIQEDSSHAPPGDRIGAATRQGTDDTGGIAGPHEEWSRDPEYQEAHVRLGEEFEQTRALIEGRTGAGFKAGGIGRAYGNNAIGGSPARERPRPPLHPNTGKDCSGNRHPP